MNHQPIFLMTDASAYDVAYRINPWMKPDAWGANLTANRQAALDASRALRIALEDSGADVRLIPPQPGLPDLVFPANAAVVLDGKALVARFLHPERAGEEPHFLRALDSLKTEGLLSRVEQIDTVHEGAGDCIWDASRQLFWVGSGPRSSPDAGSRVRNFFRRQVVELPLATKQFYHLDTCFCPLSGGEILYYPPALTPVARNRVRDLVPAHLLIEATAEEAAAFCVNAVSLDRTIVMAQPPLSLRQRLVAHGYRVLGVDLAPFILSGGGAFCMTLRLDLQSSPLASMSPAVAQGALS